MRSKRFLLLLLLPMVATPLVISAEEPKLLPRVVPARSIPVPDTVSPEMQRVIVRPLLGYWKIVPQSADEWKKLRDEAAARTLKLLPGLREQFGVRVEQQMIAGVNCYVVTPNSISEANRDRLLMLHGGYFVYNPGEAGTWEAILMAGFGHSKVISVDYRMPPDFPYPRASMTQSRSGRNW